MGKPTFKPGFEFIFSLSILAILGLPPLVSAQAQSKDMEIAINNGDTTINGTNIKDLSAAGRKEALKDINQIAKINLTQEKGKRNLVIVSRERKNGNGDEVVVEKNGFGDDGPMAAGNDVSSNDNNVKSIRIAMAHINNDPAYAYSVNEGRGRRVELQQFGVNSGYGRPMTFDNINSQNFMYTNTDNNGISTRVSYHVADHPATLDYDAGKADNTQMDMLKLTDLNIAPEFSAGKTMLMFDLPSKAAAEVQLKDNQGNLLWSEKALNGKFNKSFAMGLNGLYYLQVKQGNKLVVKEIMKD